MRKVNSVPLSLSELAQYRKKLKTLGVLKKEEQMRLLATAEYYVELVDSSSEVENEKKN